MRLSYRELIATTPGAGEFISGALGKRIHRVLIVSA